MDVFIEKIIAKKKTKQDILTMLGAAIAGCAVIYIVFKIPFTRVIAPAWVAAVAYGLYYVITSRNIEFEYAVTNGELDIDQIISQKRRKRIFSGSCKDFNVVAKLNSDKYNQEVKSIKKVIDAASSLDSPDVYFATLNYKGERTVILFEPNERMLNAFKTYIPRKVFQ